MSAAPTQLRKLRRDLEAGWPPGLTVFSGDDLYHLDLVQREILQALVPGDDAEFGLTVYGEDRVDLATVVGAARSVGMFAPRRVVLVREISALDGNPDALSDYAKDPPPDSFLLIRAPALDRRRKLHQVLAKKGRLLTFQRAAPHLLGGLSSQIQAMAREKKLVLDRTAAGLLAEACAGDFYRIDSELEKIRNWIGPEAEAPVNSKTVRQLVADSGLLTGWEVAEAILHRDRGAALAALRNLIEAGEVPIRMVGGLAWRSRSMLQAKALVEDGRGGEISRAVRTGGRPQDLIRGVGKYTLQELLRFPAYLLDADRTLKSRAVDPQAVLEHLIDRMTGPGDHAAAE